MTLYATWEEFAKDAEMLYSKDPMRFRLVTKYRHKDQKLMVKASDNQNVDSKFPHYF
ncbi:Signal recognition particle 9 kDa protein [Taenia solium]|eukprot:TsM_000398700 transcript=TsM_000398700 gene=TsM_000398700